MSLKDKLVYGVLAAVIAGGLFIGVNASINSQTTVLQQINDAGKTQVQTARALACTLVLPIGPEGRDPVQAAECWTNEGLQAPRIPG